MEYEFHIKLIHLISSDTETLSETTLNLANRNLPHSKKELNAKCCTGAGAIKH
jgi:hypothetical protein